MLLLLFWQALIIMISLNSLSVLLSTIDWKGKSNFSSQLLSYLKQWNLLRTMCNECVHKWSSWLRDSFKMYLGLTDVKTLITEPTQGLELSTYATRVRRPYTRHTDIQKHGNRLLSTSLVLVCWRKNDLRCINILWNYVVNTEAWQPPSFNSKLFQVADGVCLVVCPLWPHDMIRFLACFLNATKFAAKLSTPLLIHFQCL